MCDDDVWTCMKIWTPWATVESRWADPYGVRLTSSRNYILAIFLKPLFTCNLYLNTCTKDFFYSTSNEVYKILSPKILWNIQERYRNLELVGSLCDFTRLANSFIFLPVYIDKVYWVLHAYYRISDRCYKAGSFCRVRLPFLYINQYKTSQSGKTMDFVSFWLSPTHALIDCFHGK